MKTESFTNALNKSRKNGLARLKIIGVSGDRSKTNQPPTPPTISVVELPKEESAQKRSPKPKTTDRRRPPPSAGNYAEHSTKKDRITSSKQTPIVVVSRPLIKSENKAGVYYYHPTFLEQMKSMQCLRVLRSVYHRYGLKHIVLMAVLLGYSFMGAGLFLFLEQPAETIRLKMLDSKLDDSQRIMVNRIIDLIFNDTQRFLIFLSSEQTTDVEDILMKSFSEYKTEVTNQNYKHGVYSEMRWDFSNSMLYAWTIITTIGYGYLHPTTVKGKVITMIYAIFGIPLFLSVLNDLGKLLTKLMKYPFFLFKKYTRRLFQYCTRMSRDQIKEAEAKDKARLEVFDLPVPLAIGIVIGWIFICSAITLTWEQDWDYLVAFYFFFISLSTIGFGDVMPSDTRYLLIMFGNIVIGLALVSMCINLIQVKLEKTYQANSSGSPERRERSEESTDETSESGSGGPHRKSSRHQNKQTNGIKSLFKRATSQISLSALSSQSRQASQTSLTNYGTGTPPPLPQTGPPSDDESAVHFKSSHQQAPTHFHGSQTPTHFQGAQTPTHFQGAQTPTHFQGAQTPTHFQGSQTPMPIAKKYSKSSSPDLSKKSSRTSPTPSEPARHVQHSDSDVQTMLSIPSYQKGDDDKNRVINVSNQRGTIRTLPSTTSFNEIDRIVNLNINAELLRNELIDLETYHNILSPQEVMAQIHQERKLHHVDP